jgi:NAD(P)-dependent dehydrogenase (short-subunit alcohol dehydrogenase family)
MRWKASDMPDQSGRTAVITGANSGIGYATARELARHGAEVLLACRSAERGRVAEVRLKEEVPDARIRLALLDLADLSSVRRFAEAYEKDTLDLLINNAGVMALPYATTADGFEMQFGINHLGHFALTGLLLPRLLNTPGARVVTVSSLTHMGAKIDPANLNGERRYGRWAAYARSKCANLLFTHELSRRLAAVGTDVVAAAAHPGYAATSLQTAGAKSENRRAVERFFEIGNRFFAQSPESGALPTLYAATAPGVEPNSFIGPAFLGWRGSPGRSVRAKWTRDDRAGEVLWEASERLTGVTYEDLKA